MADTQEKKPGQDAELYEPADGKTLEFTLVSLSDGRGRMENLNLGGIITAEDVPELEGYKAFLQSHPGLEQVHVHIHPFELAGSDERRHATGEEIGQILEMDAMLSYYEHEKLRFPANIEGPSQFTLSTQDEGPSPAMEPTM